MRITVETALQHGLTAEEYERIETTLGRTPTLEELGETVRQINGEGTARPCDIRDIAACGHGTSPA